MSWRKQLRRRVLANLELDGVYLSAAQARLAYDLLTRFAMRERLSSAERDLLLRLGKRVSELPSVPSVPHVSPFGKIR